MRHRGSLSHRLYTKPEDTAEYIEHRLREAGTEKTILSSGALSLIHEATQGSLRDLDRVAALIASRP